MSLYDDIITGPNAPKLASSPGIKLLQEHLQAKKRNHPTTSSDSSASGTKNAKTSGTSSHVAGSLLGGDWDPRDEYDPLWPNEFDIVQRLANEKQLAAKEAENKTKQKTNQANNVDSDNDDDSPRPTLRGLQGYSEDEEEEGNIVKKQKRTKTKATRNSPERPLPQLAANLGISSVAARIMSKMGYREGQGLGKDEQGIDRALEVEKTSASSSRIVEPSDRFAVTSSDSSSNVATVDSIAEIVKNPTRVVLLRNMVGPGEVDDELDGETKEECTKYGEVIKCLIFEMPKKRVPDDEAVRIFVEFKTVESAIKAVVDLNGRFFGGRTVKASFYDVDKFNKFELAPPK